MLFPDSCFIAVFKRIKTDNIDLTYKSQLHLHLSALCAPMFPVSLWVHLSWKPFRSIPFDEAAPHTKQSLFLQIILNCTDVLFTRVYI